jgi:prevent-host-death family protein
MESVGLFEAKTHLSELVARAERGESTVITRHNRPVARIVPVDDVTLSAPPGRHAALQALQSFDPIPVPGASLSELIQAGRS